MFHCSISCTSFDFVRFLKMEHVLLGIHSQVYKCNLLFLVPCSFSHLDFSLQTKFKISFKFMQLISFFPPPTLFPLSCSLHHHPIFLKHQYLKTCLDKQSLSCTESKILCSHGLTHSLPGVTNYNV